MLPRDLTDVWEFLGSAEAEAAIPQPVLKKMIETIAEFEDWTQPRAITTTAGTSKNIEDIFEYARTISKQIREEEIPKKNYNKEKEGIWLTDVQVQKYLQKRRGKE